MKYIVLNSKHICMIIVSFIYTTLLIKLGETDSWVTIENKQRTIFKHTFNCVIVPLELIVPNFDIRSSYCGG